MVSNLLQKSIVINSRTIFNFTADPGYSALISAEPDRWDQAFRFVDGMCELHLYTNGVDEIENPTSLEDVARALINMVEVSLL